MWSKLQIVIESMNHLLENLFGFDSQKHSVRTEIVAGITTFLTMAYILAVNPSIFSALSEMPSGSVFTATALASIIGTLVMALYAKKPFALAPGMGLNAFFVFTVCLGMGYSWKFALTAVLLEGIIFVILTVTKVRSLLLDAIPGTLKKAIGAGIGLFIAFIGMEGAGIIVSNDATLVGLGDISKGTALLAMIGLLRWVPSLVCIRRQIWAHARPQATTSPIWIRCLWPTLWLPSVAPAWEPVPPPLTLRVPRV